MTADHCNSTMSNCLAVSPAKLHFIFRSALGADNRIYLVNFREQTRPCLLVSACIWRVILKVLIPIRLEISWIRSSCLALMLDFPAGRSTFSNMRHGLPGTFGTGRVKSVAPYQLYSLRRDMLCSSHSELPDEAANGFVM